jgi:triphosphatase
MGGKPVAVTAMQSGLDLRTLTEFAARETEADAPAAATWHKAPALILTADASAEDALVAAFRNGLEHLDQNRHCVLARAHEEGVHQMRVASRRLRSRLALYEELIPEDDRAPLQAALKWLIGRLGPARDWDVFLLEVAPRATERFPDDPDLAGLIAAAEARRDRGYRRAAKALASDRYRAVTAALATSAEARPWRTEALSDAQRAGLDEPVRAFADRLARQRHDALLAMGADFATMAPTERHRLRIEIKKVRYAAEFFAPLYPEQTLRAYLGVLKDLQDDLGAANDRVVARGLMLSLAEGASKTKGLTLALAAGLVIAAQPPVASSEAKSIALWNAFCEAAPYWD